MMVFLCTKSEIYRLILNSLENLVNFRFKFRSENDTIVVSKSVE